MIAALSEAAWIAGIRLVHVPRRVLYSSCDRIALLHAIIPYHVPAAFPLVGTNICAPRLARYLTGRLLQPCFGACSNAHCCQAPSRTAQAQRLLVFLPATAARERVVGWYSTGPRLREADPAIHSLMARYCDHPVLVRSQARDSRCDLPRSALCLANGNVLRTQFQLSHGAIRPADLPWHIALHAIAPPKHAVATPQYDFRYQSRL